MILRFTITANKDKIPIKVKIHRGNITIGQVMYDSQKAIYLNGCFEIKGELKLKTNNGDKTITRIKCPKDKQWQVEEELENIL